MASMAISHRPHSPRAAPGVHGSPAHRAARYPEVRHNRASPVTPARAPGTPPMARYARCRKTSRRRLRAAKVAAKSRGPSKKSPVRKKRTVTAAPCDFLTERIAVARCNIVRAPVRKRGRFREIILRQSRSPVFCSRPPAPHPAPWGPHGPSRVVRVGRDDAATSPPSSAASEAYTGGREHGHRTTGAAWARDTAPHPAPPPPHTPRRACPDTPPPARATLQFFGPRREQHKSTPGRRQGRVGRPSACQHNRM